MEQPKTSQSEEKKLDTPTEEGANSLRAEKKGKIESLLFSIGIEDRSAKVVLVALLIVLALVSSVSFFLLSPSNFPVGKIITVKKGAPLGTTADQFAAEHLIRSQTIFKFCVMITGGDKSVASGDYYFKEKLGACSLALRLTSGNSGIPQFRAIITEGMTNKDIAELLTPTSTNDPLIPNLSKFDPNFFLDHARANEGYLFPDTYFFASNATAQTVESTMRANFDKKTESLRSAIEASRHSLRDIVIMASILEKEVRTPEDMALVSGILWKRVKIGMPLQVDATFYYVLGKRSNELTDTDLAIKSAYNTYKNKGLPAGPIGNPGLTAIKAAIEPKESPYLYYLSDKNGVTHYAKTFDEHKINKVKYLGN